MVSVKLLPFIFLHCFPTSPLVIKGPQHRPCLYQHTLPPLAIGHRCLLPPMTVEAIKLYLVTLFIDDCSYSYNGVCWSGIFLFSKRFSVCIKNRVHFLNLCFCFFFFFLFIHSHSNNLWCTSQLKCPVTIDDKVQPMLLGSSSTQVRKRYLWNFFIQCAKQFNLIQRVLLTTWYQNIYGDKIISKMWLIKNHFNVWNF